jgi:hypothetical protein
MQQGKGSHILKDNFNQHLITNKLIIIFVCDHIFKMFWASFIQSFMSRNFLTYVDTHCHIDNTYERLKLDYSLFFDNFVSNFPPSFEGCLNIFSDSFDSSMLFIGWNHPKIFGAFGMHPHNANVYSDEFEKKLSEF